MGPRRINVQCLVAERQSQQHWGSARHVGTGPALTIGREFGEPKANIM